MFEFYKDKLVAVTGSTGLNGSYIVKALAEAGAKVRALVHERELNEYTKLADEIVRADLMDAGSTRAAIAGAEIVMHAAGVTGGTPLAINDPGAMVAPNAIMNSQIIHAAAKEKVKRLGFISSIIVYPPLTEPLREDQAWSGEPYELYFGLCWVKRFSEKLCQFYFDKCGLGVGIIRPSASYGRYDNFDENTSHVLPAIIKRAVSEADPLVIWGDGEDARDFVHASDIAKGLLLAVEKYPNCTPINIASGRPCTTRELAELALQVTGSKSRLEFDLSKPTSLKLRLVDISRARNLLGYTPSVSLADGVRDAVAWYKGQL